MPGSRKHPGGLTCGPAARRACAVSIELCALELGWGGHRLAGEGLGDPGTAPIAVARWCGIDAALFFPSPAEGGSAGDPTKAREKLGWTPTTTLEELVGGSGLSRSAGCRQGSHAPP